MCVWACLNDAWACLNDAWVFCLVVSACSSLVCQVLPGPAVHQLSSTYAAESSHQYDSCPKSPQHFVGGSRHSSKYACWPPFSWQLFILPRSKSWCLPGPHVHVSDDPKLGYCSFRERFCLILKNHMLNTGSKLCCLV